MRLFIAVPVADSARERVKALIDELSRTGADYKWVETHNLHLTLAFLGETDAAKIPTLAGIVDTAASRPPFELGFDGRPHDAGKVLWLPVLAGAEQMKGLFASVDAALKAATFHVESRPYAPHLTLGRIRGRRNQQALSRRLKTMPAAPFSSPAGKLQLIESKLSSAGPSYTVVHEAAFHA